MKIHKSTDTNVTLCGISTRGRIMSINWKDVDCRHCLRIGQQDFLNRFPEVKLNEQQAELNLEDTNQ